MIWKLQLIRFVLQVLGSIFYVSLRVGQRVGDVIIEGSCVLRDVRPAEEDTTEELVEEPCRMALIHESVMDGFLGLGVDCRIEREAYSGYC